MNPKHKAAIERAIEALELAKVSCDWSWNNALGSQGILFENAAKARQPINDALSDLRALLAADTSEPAQTIAEAASTPEKAEKLVEKFYGVTYEPATPYSTNTAEQVALECAIKIANLPFIGETQLGFARKAEPLVLAACREVAAMETGKEMFRLQSMVSESERLRAQAERELAAKSHALELSNRAYSELGRELADVRNELSCTHTHCTARHKELEASEAELAEVRTRDEMNFAILKKVHEMLEMTNEQSYSLIPEEIEEWMASVKLYKAKEVAATDRAVLLEASIPHRIAEAVKATGAVEHLGNYSKLAFTHPHLVAVGARSSYDALRQLTEAKEK